VRLEIRSRHIPVTDELRAWCERRVDFSLSHFRDRIRDVTLRLEDANGPKGGLDKRCVLVIRLRRGAPIVLSTDDSSVMAAVDRSVDRAGQAVSRALERERQGLDLGRRAWGAGVPA
jgi:ribosome-associated translation inhibitor RaiA